MKERDFMKLIIGGACQGKLAYAKETYHIADGWADGRSCGREDLRSCRGIHHFHEYIRRMASSGEQFAALEGLEQQAGEFARMLAKENPGLVIVSDELGYGIVPVEKTDRLWRELTGRICTCLAAQADEVVRVVCGIGIKIK